jgi:uncharacterized protein (UPF0548 family)
MFLLYPPNAAQIKRFLKARESDVFSYPEVGASRDEPYPPGYDVDHNRVLLGRGKDDFDRAVSAIKAWKMFDVPGLKLFEPDTQIEPGRNVALLARHLGFYSLNSCRIVYVIDEVYRFGFAYGTLKEHLEVGEERFAVEHHRASGEVWYDILAFSSPGHFLVKLGYPYGRYKQRQFAIESKAAMQRAVSTSQNLER